MKKIIVDKDICIGCGFCAASFDKIFTMDDDDLAKAEDIDFNELDDEDKETVLDTKEGCPVDAIKIDIEDDKK